jgi:hypothetical protein
MSSVEGSWGWNSNVLAKDRSTDTNVLPLSTDSFSTTLVQLGLENHDRVFLQLLSAIFPRQLRVLLEVSLSLVVLISLRACAQDWLKIQACSEVLYAVLRVTTAANPNRDTLTKPGQRFDQSRFKVCNL